MNRLSLRTRLVAVAVALVAFAVLVVGIATYTVLSRTLYDQLDDRVRTTSTEVLGYLSGPTGGPPRVDREAVAGTYVGGKASPLPLPRRGDSGLDLDNAVAATVVAADAPVTVRTEAGESVIGRMRAMFFEPTGSPVAR